MNEEERIVLDLLKNKEKYGYEMIRELEKTSEKVFEQNRGMLFPVLRGLEKQKIIKSFQIQVNGKTRRSYKMKENRDLDRE